MPKAVSRWRCHSQREYDDSKNSVVQSLSSAIFDVVQARRRSADLSSGGIGGLDFRRTGVHCAPSKADGQ
jgi:hypothetical protein